MDREFFSHVSLRCSSVRWNVSTDGRVSLQDESIYQLVAAGPVVLAEDAFPRVASQQPTVSSSAHTTGVLQRHCLGLVCNAISETYQRLRGLPLATRDDGALRERDYCRSESHGLGTGSKSADPSAGRRTRQAYDDGRHGEASGLLP